MIALRQFLSLLITCFLISSCQKKEAQKETSVKEDSSFFTGKAEKIETNLVNRMAEAPTDYLKTYADIPLPFQCWSPDLLALSKKTQKPIFVYIANASTASSRAVAKDLFLKSSLTEEFSNQYICTVVSIEQAPEIALLAFHLASEIKQAVNFPMLLWLTHEGNPIAWLPLNDKQSIESLVSITQNSSAMVQDIWKNSSLYTIENSRRDNETRINRLNSIWKKNKKSTSRKAAFISYAREYISLYNPLDQNFDGAGGLLPARTVSFTSLIARHPAISDNSRDDARTALTGLVNSLNYSAMHDPVDDGYFMLNRGEDWSLPLFSKTLSTQAEYAISLFLAAQVLDTPEAMHNATKLLSHLEKNMLGDSPREIICHITKTQQGGLFVWSLPELKNFLTPEEYQLARQVFHLTELGNINLESVANRNFFRLNSLSYQDAQSAAVLADPAKAKIYQSIIDKLSDLRVKKADNFFVETTIPASSLATVVRLYATAYRVTSDEKYLANAKKYAAILQTRYLPKDEIPLRFAESQETFRGQDYARCILAFCDLYQLTLNSQWFDSADRLATQALENLQNDDGSIAESSKKNRVANIAISDSSMIFTDSSLALLEAGLAQLGTIAGNKKYQDARNRIWSALSVNLDRAYFIKADILQACAYGDAPLVCVLHGPPDDPKNLALRKILQDPLYAQTSILTTAEKYRATQVPDNKNPGLTILQNQKIIAEITDPVELDKKMRELIANP